MRKDKRNENLSFSFSPLKRVDKTQDRKKIYKNLYSKPNKAVDARKSKQSEF